MIEIPPKFAGRPPVNPESIASGGQCLKDLEERVRQYLAWSSIERDVEALDLAPTAANQAETKRQEAEMSVAAQIGETWTWRLVPEQPDPMGDVEWSDIRTTGQDALAIRASKKLENEPGQARCPVLQSGRYWPARTVHASANKTAKVPQTGRNAGHSNTG